MTPDLWFSIVNSLALAAWLILILVPGWRYTARLVTAVIVPGLLALLYTVLVLVYLGSAEGGFGSLAGVEALFQNRWVLLAGWVHYLAFDLFIGSWEVRDSQRLEISYWLVLPCLVLTFLLGPIGLGSYLILRYALRREALVGGSDDSPVD